MRMRNLEIISTELIVKEVSKFRANTVLSLGKRKQIPNGGYSFNNSGNFFRFFWQTECMPVFSADDSKNILRILAASMRIWRPLTKIGTKLAYCL